MLENNTRYDITPENLEKVQKELVSLYEEDFVIDILPSNEDDIKVVTKAIIKTTQSFGLADGAVYDLLVKAFEEIK